MDWRPVCAAIVCPTRFNRCLDRWDSKAAVLAETLAYLLRAVEEHATDSLDIVIDKHGGRNTYAAMLQHALPGGVVVARQEGRERSVYEVHGLAQPVRICFRPRADSEHLCVALASMVSKYLRELLMGEFNAFWRRHLPDLKPTAGYPLDAARFFAAIRPIAEQLGIAESTLWRRR